MTSTLTLLEYQTRTDLIPVELAWQITELGDSPNIWSSHLITPSRGWYEETASQNSEKISEKLATLPSVPSWPVSLIMRLVKLTPVQLTTRINWWYYHESIGEERQHINFQLVLSWRFPKQNGNMICLQNPPEKLPWSKQHIKNSIN